MVIVPITDICPKCWSKYQAFQDEAKDALLRVSPAAYTVLMGDFNAHVGTDTDTSKGVIGKHKGTGLNEKGMYLLQFCCSNGLCSPHYEYLLPEQRCSEGHMISI